jgi:flagellar basal body rod protein FlgB
VLNGLTGRSSVVADLKEGLNASARELRVIAHRVANASTPESGFGEVLDAANGAGPVDLEAEMVKLADEQLRFQAAAKLLEQVYAQIRSSVRER